jgi:16S rRNA (cytidine1402-2'-O)-methyltransferase
MPCIADPGAILVRRAHEKGIKVVPIPGPSSIFLALAASGLNGQAFAFHGYLPINEAERKQRIKELEALSLRTAATQIFMETPYRNEAMFNSIIAACQPETSLCVAADLTLETAYIKTCKISTWKKTDVSLHKRPAIFLLSANA